MTKVRKFEAPGELAEKFGVYTQQEHYIGGLVKTEDIRELLDAFGLHERRDVVLPFQHLKKQHGEVWGMRVESLASHNVEGSPVMAHAWVFMQHQPETVSGAQ